MQKSGVALMEKTPFLDTKANEKLQSVPLTALENVPLISSKRVEKRLHTRLFFVSTKVIFLGKKNKFFQEFFARKKN